MPDGKELVILSGTRFKETICRMQVSRAGKLVQIALPSENAFAPSISRTGRRLAYCVEKYDSNIWRVDLRERDGMPGRPVQLISSTKNDRGAAYSTDSKRIAFVSERAGTEEVWSCVVRAAIPRNSPRLGSN